MKNKNRTTITIDSELKTAIKMYAASLGLTMREYINQVLEESIADGK